VEALRTPDERFADLPGYPFAPHYLSVDDLRVHYVDEGSASGPPVLLLHGEPSWSYLYRAMIPIIAAAGYHVLAPDLVGFGRSDKPTAREDYTYQRHVDWMRGLLLGLDLSDITLFCQDWGGLIGLRLVADHSERFARVIAANTGLPTGDQPMTRAFFAWQAASQAGETLDVGNIVRLGCATALTDDVVAAYDAPFPDERYKVGARQFPLLVPTYPDDPASAANRQAWEALKRFDKPFLTAFSDGDRITRGGDKLFQELIPGAAGQPHVTITGARHFLQEDRGDELARIVVDFARRDAKP
jgi:haloalkane dehalogenase